MTSNRNHRIIKNSKLSAQAIFTHTEINYYVELAQSANSIRLYPNLLVTIEAQENIFSNSPIRIGLYSHPGKS